MPRNVSGTYTLPLPPVVPNTTIESDWANETLADISQALTDSLDRTGRGGLTAPFRLVDGTAAQPGLSFNAETGTGLYRAAPGQMGVTVMGTPVGGWTDEGFAGLFTQIDGNPTFTGIPVFDDGLTTNGLVIAPGFRAALGDGNAPSYEWWNTAAPTDKQRYVAYGSAAGDWTFQAMNDTGTIADHWFSLRRPPTDDVGAGLPGWFFGGAGNSLMTLEGSSGVVAFGLDASSSAIPRAIQFRTNAKPRWNIEVAGSEGGGRTGSDLGFARADDDGTYLGPVLKFDRVSGGASFLAGYLAIFGGTGPGNSAMTTLDLRAVSSANTINGVVAGQTNWQIQLPGTDSHFAIHRFNSANGDYLGTPFQIDRTNGWVTFANNITVGGTALITSNLTSLANITAQQQLVTWSSIEVGHPSGGGTPFIDFHTTNGSDFDARILAAGNPATIDYIAGYHRFQSPGGLECSNGFYSNGNATVRTNSYPSLIIDYTGVGKKVLRVAPDNNFEIINSANTQAILRLSDDGKFDAIREFVSRQGQNGAIISSSTWGYAWTGNLEIWIDTTRIGWVNVSTSDERIKHSITPMGLLDEDVFAKITPIKFRWQDIPPFIDDGVDHWGFSAQNILDYAPLAVKGSVTETGPNGEIYPANIDLMAILGQTILQLQALQARCTAAGI